MLLQAAAKVTDVAWIPHCCDYGIGQQLHLLYDPWPQEHPYAVGVAIKRKKNHVPSFFNFLILMFNIFIMFILDLIPPLKKILQDTINQCSA